MDESTDERWRPVAGCEGVYEVSDRGRVRSYQPRGRAMHTTASPHLLRANISPTGYHCVSLYTEGVRRNASIHRLVLTAFVGPAPEGTEGCHNDGDPSNNGLQNLRWDTHSANAYDMVRHGTSANAAKTHCKRGHEYTSDNTIRAPKGRLCRACARARGLEYKARRKQKEQS